MATGRAANVGGAALSSSMQKAGLVTLTGGYPLLTGAAGVWVGWNSPMDQPDLDALRHPAAAPFMIGVMIGGISSEAAMNVPAP